MWANTLKAAKVHETESKRRKSSLRADATALPSYNSREKVTRIGIYRESWGQQVHSCISLSSTSRPASLAFVPGAAPLCSNTNSSFPLKIRTKRRRLCGWLAKCMTDE